MADRFLDLEGRVAIVTGGGRGIGRMYCKAFAAHGAIPVIADLTEPDMANVKGEIEAEGGQVLAIKTDVSDLHSVLAMVEEVKAAFGRIDILVNNAALFTFLERNKFYDIPLEEFEDVLRVNVTGTFLPSKAVAPAMIEAGWGRIIHISSGTVPMGMEMFAHYVTSKAAVIGMARTMARDVGEHGITVNVLLPGQIHTEEGNPNRPQAAVDLVQARQALKGLQEPQDLVGTVLFLSSWAARFITGQSIAVDGGVVHL